MHHQYLVYGVAAVFGLFVLWALNWFFTPDRPSPEEPQNKWEEPDPPCGCYTKVAPPPLPPPADSVSPYDRVLGYCPPKPPPPPLPPVMLRISPSPRIKRLKRKTRKSRK